MLLGAHLAGLAFSNAPSRGVHALAYRLEASITSPRRDECADVATCAQHKAAAAREHYAELGADRRQNCEAEGSQARADADRQAGRTRPESASPRAARLRDRRRRGASAGARSDEADAAAGTIHVRLPKPMRSGSTRQLGERRLPRRVRFQALAFHDDPWADNDAYGHVNNTVTTSGSTRRKRLDVEQGCSTSPWRSDRSRRRNAVHLHSPPISAPIEIGLAVPKSTIEHRYRIGIFAEGAAVRRGRRFRSCRRRRTTRRPVEIRRNGGGSWKRSASADARLRGAIFSDSLATSSAPAARVDRADALS